MCPLISNLVRAFYGHLPVYFHLSLEILEILSNCKLFRRVLQWEGGKKIKRWHAHRVHLFLCRCVNCVWITIYMCGHVSVRYNWSVVDLVQLSQQLSQTAHEKIPQTHRLDMAVKGGSGGTRLVVSATVCRKSSSETLNCRLVYNKVSHLSISIRKALSGCFPFRRGLAAFVNVKELTSFFMVTTKRPWNRQSMS